MKNLERVLKACADINRLRILKMLEKKKMCVCELASVLGISQPSVSRHLKKLKEAGLIDYEQERFWTNYYLGYQNEYSKEILLLLRSWENDNNRVKKDLEKASITDRSKVCSKK